MTRSRAAILVHGVRGPPHTQNFTPESWQAELDHSGQVFERVDVLMSRFSELDCASLSEAKWKNIACLDKLVFFMPLDATSLGIVLALQRCINAVIASLPSALIVESIVICNTPAAVLMRAEEQDATGLATALKVLFNELDVQLGARITRGALKHVVFATSSPCTTPLGENERVRMRTFFPELTHKRIV